MFSEGTAEETEVLVSPPLHRTHFAGFCVRSADKASLRRQNVTTLPPVKLATHSLQWAVDRTLRYDVPHEVYTRSTSTQIRSIRSGTGEDQEA